MADRAGAEPTEVEMIVALAMQHHLPIKLPDDVTVMCLCHSRQEALFDGPVPHRWHVARVVLADLSAAGYEVSPSPAVSGVAATAESAPIGPETT